MSNHQAFTDAQLIAFLDEELEPSLSSRVESALRDDPELRQQLTILRGQNLAGLHTIGAIWRRHRLTCPDRNQLSQYLDGKLSLPDTEYIDFHVREIHCRVCNANLDDLRNAQSDHNGSSIRRRRVFESSAGHLRKSGG
jgi:anti-sigma factor RsiW